LSFLSFKIAKEKELQQDHTRSTLQGDHDMICDGNVWNVWIMGQKMVHP
jgi:hypothetical protein